ncbi:putative methyltransferase [Oleiphilus messinensis]|uniref:Putative methyltransferase n=1 Tax=Oleiphilus messinensis TaxID=141451 RepID=A0A1Y0I427_9GAMM|nr:L-histidine N(alpha)-methyltransferase [Oleiphilus messinensis]ARU54959.1 putative methyltransferase [Oleiphilus messinensis]
MLPLSTEFSTESLVRFYQVAGEDTTDHCHQVLDGLQLEQKTISPKYFYDERGSELFDQITRLPEYYPTRTEQAILELFGAEIAQALDSETLLIEPGSGGCQKVRELLQHRFPAAYAPIEISGDYLKKAVSRLSREYPDMDIHAICADFTTLNRLPGELDGEKRVAFFPGSTIGNFEPEKAAGLLRNFAELVGDDGALLLGVDTLKDADVLHAAYNDAQGITAEFNLNMLDHLNRLIGAEFDRRYFHHEAFFNETSERIEMHLRCDRAHSVKVGSRTVDFQQGETIHTENSYKYSPERLDQLVSRAGFERQQSWFDDDQQFGFHLLKRVTSIAGQDELSGRS